MAYLIVFLEGVITFVSPCILPMLPLYVSYFAGNEEKHSKRVVINACGFVIGFSIVFVTLGMFSGFLGGFFVRYSFVVNIVAGILVIAFGLYYLGILRFRIFPSFTRKYVEVKQLSFYKAVLFGMVFSTTWTPCVGAFLGSALLLAASSGGGGIQGFWMLVFYSLGLGLPFIISALFIDQLKSTFDRLKKNQKTIHLISGGFLLVMGILIMTGIFDRLLSYLA